MKVRLDIDWVCQLTSLIQSLDLLQAAVPDLGVARFDKRWHLWTDDERREFLSSVKDVVRVMRPIRQASIVVESEHTGSSEPNQK